MFQHRESPVIVSLTQIVLLSLLESTTEVLLFVTDTSCLNIYGEVLAYSGLSVKNRVAFKQNLTEIIQVYPILKSDIREYRVVTLSELPLFIEYEYTSPKLAELIKGD
jgi:hypothetical protein